MKLLVLTNNPTRASFRQRIGIYVSPLRSRGITCEVAVLPQNYLVRQKLFKLAADFDGIFLHKKGLNPFDAFWLRRYSKKIIYDFDDAVMYSPKAPGRDRSSHFRLFKRDVKLADMVLAGNSYLSEYAKRYNDHVEVLPTGLNIHRYKTCPGKERDGRIRLVWIGSKSTLKYLAEIKAALEEIGSRFDNVVLRIVCDDFFELKNMAVEKHEWSQETEVHDLVTSDIGLAPLPENRFTRGKCGFKILQYEASNLPVVSSPVGVNAAHVCDNVTGFLALDARAWVDKTSQLIENPQLRKRMGDAGRVNVEKFDIGVIGKKLYYLITECIGTALDNKEEIQISTKQAGKLSTSQKKVSVCIPTYNRKRYLKETIDSILAQTYKDYEIVIVDDGSIDGTEDMVKQLGFPVTYHWQENSGDAAARNKLIELARGQYIAFIDSDDLLLPDALERMVKAIEAGGEDVIVYGSYFRIDQDGRIYGKCKRKLYSGNITKYLFETVLIHPCGSMFRKRILNGPLAFDTSLKVCSDYDFWLRLSTKYRLVALPEPTFTRRRHPGNLSKATFENCLTEFKVLERFYYEQGGNKILPRRAAMRRLSAEGYRAGKCAIEEGRYQSACELMLQSFRQCPNAKSLLRWVGAALGNRLEH